MEYSDFKECKLSKLGFGAMRLPLREDRSIDKPQVATMVEMAMKSGVNYFDTAWPYHDGKSETVIGEALSNYPRESWYLADKFPGHQTASSYEPEKLFEAQMKKCNVDYFDFYLLHNVCESSIDIYLDPKWGIGDYFVKQRDEGRIRHLGFSSHAELETLKAFLDTPIGEEMEFCQIQLNYMDWSLQDAKAKVDLLNEHNIPIWVMEPLRGGCPMGLDIPSLIKSYNDMKTAFSFTPLMKVEALQADKRPSACVGCGACAQICPQRAAATKL